MHLPGKTHARNVRAAQPGFREGRFDGKSAGAPPIFRVLLGPANLRRTEMLMLFRSGRDDFSLCINDQGARSARAYINPK